MALTPYGRNALLNGVPMPALWLAHHTGAPGPDGLSNQSTDCRDGSRRALARLTAVAETTSNTDVVDVVLSVAETYTDWSLHDAPTGGNCWWTGAYDTPRTYMPLDVARIPVGYLDLSIT